MRSDKGKAFVLRRSGKSYRQISSELGVAKSTLTAWFSGVDFSKAIKEELTREATKKGRKHLENLNRTRGIALKVQYELAEKEAIKEMKLYRHLPLFTAGISIYWGEGDKRSRNQVRVTNTDYKMLQVFVAFLTELCGVPKDKLRLALFIYEDLADDECRKYWSRKLKIKNFQKTQVLPSRHKVNRLPYGVCTVVLSHTLFKKKLLCWIDHLPEMVLNTVPKR